MEKQHHWAGWIIIGVGVILGITILAFNTSTAGEPPASASPSAEESLLRQLFPYAGEGEEAFEKLELAENSGLEEGYAILRGGEVLGHAARITVQGYAGPIEVVVGLRPDGSLAGLHVGGDSFRETEGLGAKAKESDFTDQFIGKTPPVSLGNEIDAISGATVTSRAVTDGVNAAADALKTHMHPSAQTQGRTANASVIGYGGPVLVRLTLDDSGIITSADIADIRFQETDGVGGRIRESAFMDQFIGLTPPLSLGQEIDGIAGATVSSQAAVDAVNAAAAFLAQ